MPLRLAHRAYVFSRCRSCFSWLLCPFASPSAYVLVACCLLLLHLPCARVASGWTICFAPTQRDWDESASRCLDQSRSRHRICLAVDMSDELQNFEKYRGPDKVRGLFPGFELALS